MASPTGRRSRDLFGPETSARSLGLLLMTAGLLSLLTELLPHTEMIRSQLLVGVGTITALAGFGIGSRVRSVRALPWLAALGTLLIGACNYAVAGTVVYPVTLTWIALYSFTFLDRRIAYLQTLLVGAVYAVLVATETPNSPITRFAIIVGTPVVAGVMISRLLARLRDEVQRADERAEILAESELRTRAIVQAAPDAFMTVDEGGIVVAWNKAAEQMFGLPADQAMGTAVSEIVVVDDPDQLAMHEHRRRRISSLPAGSPPERYEIELARGGTGGFPAEVSAAPVSAGDAKLLAVFVRDLSDRAERDRERAELMREQTAREEAERIATVVQGLQRLLDVTLAHDKLDDMLAALLPRLCEVLDADDAAILLTEDDGSLLLHAATGELGPERLRLDLGEGIAGRAAEGGESLLVQEPADDEPLAPCLRGVQSLLTVPLMAGAKATGVIQVGAPARRFSDDDLTVLGLAADRVALAIQHTRVYEREHKIAETLQRSLLPEKLPTLPGLEVAARYIPAAAEAEVGGDWYDVIPIDSGRVGLVMGDVAGKGLAAASMVGRLRSTLRAYALEGHEAAVVVERLNEMVCSELGESDMATLIYLVVDLGAGTISWVNAGHLPPLVRENGHPRLLEGARSVPLGVMPFADYEQSSIAMGGGASVLLYTDGLVERPGEPLDDGLARLQEAASGETLRPEMMCDHVLATLVPDGAASDDVALLALHLPGLDEAFSLTLPSDPGELAALRALVRRWLIDAGVGDRDSAEILAAVGEAAANAIEHGSSSPQDHFTVTGAFVGEEVQIAVSDRGTWIEPKNTSGRGLVLMRSLMDSVEITKESTGTTVSKARRVGRDVTDGDGAA